MEIEAIQLQGHLEGMVLAVLSSRPGHGYEVIRRLAVSSEGALSLPEGTVYPALHRLESLGFLVSRWEVVDGRRRRVYSVTTAGKARLGQRRSLWRVFSTAVGRVLDAAGPDGAPVQP